MDTENTYRPTIKNTKTITICKIIMAEFPFVHFKCWDIVERKRYLIKVYFWYMGAPMTVAYWFNPNDNIIYTARYLKRQIRGIIQKERKYRHEQTN